MDYDSFLFLNANRLESYILRFAKTFGLSGEPVADLRQEAHIAAFRALPYWREGQGHMSPFNWCAGPMRRAMEKAIKREFGMRPCSSEPIYDRREAYDEERVCYAGTDSMGSLGDIIDLKAAIARDKKPAQIRRLVMAAFSPDSEVVLAKKVGISRQSLWASNDRAKTRLLRRLG